MSRLLQRPISRRAISPPLKPPLHSNGSRVDVAVTTSVAGALLDYSLMLLLVFGGCCSNVWAYEELLRAESSAGPALTFSQMLFITVQQLPSFVIWDTSRSWLPLPRLKLKPRRVPISQWLVLVTTFASGTLLNNLVFAFDVPLTIQIIFRSAGLAVSMLLGRVFAGKRYTLQQITAVAVVSSGVVIATLSRPRTTTTTTTMTMTTTTSAADAHTSRYAIGVAMLLMSLVCTGVHGALQERTYSTYGPHWREGVFYMHMLSLPLFAFMPGHVRRGFVGLSSSNSRTGRPYTILALNLLSQLVCVSGVNQLSSRVSAVSTQVVLTARKAISLCFSVWWFGGGSGWNLQFACGAFMVFVGSFWYSILPATTRGLAAKKQI